MSERSAGVGQPSRVSGDSRAKLMRYLSWLARRRGALVALGAAVLLVVGGVAFHQSGSSPKPVSQALAPQAAATQATAPPAKAAPRPALSAAEEVYIRALWPIHGDVERSAVRVSLGVIFYKTGDLDWAELKNRLEAARVSYQKAEAQMSGLDPPKSFAVAHGDYLAAVRLFQQATAEALKMVADGNDEHLVLAYPLSHEASNKIREIGGRFWRDEFPPN